MSAEHDAGPYNEFTLNKNVKRDLYYSDTVTAFTYITFLIFVELVSWQCIISDFEVRVVIWHLYSQYWYM